MGATLGPLVAPWPCDTLLAREHVLQGADATRRAEIESAPAPVDVMAAGVVDAVTQGLAGLEHDIALQVTPPDIELGDVVCPVRLWYGALDRSAPPAFGHWYAADLPAASLVVLDGEGHCFVLPRWAEILAAIR